ncbi:MAG: 4Fe-4S dicluster domain-containing protein [Armatimonadetes bacterium]|nr:4Fe-4S dicluster domain-containing protein [Armatimonadota bacterium]
MSGEGTATTRAGETGAPSYEWGSSQWGMVIDADRCTGCKACVIACRSENNTAVVGAEQCAMGRIMDWLRVDRFYHGEYPNLRGEFVPMLCQHCGTAPCESVCPVFASTHTHDGLNAQVYNRCVGTRLCGNNCPYHVRVFNFKQPRWPRPMENLLNPDVSVRNEGVMEKCTFCVQRIRRTELNARVKGTVVEDGEIRPACVQACPTSALVFGDLFDPESAVSRLLEVEASRTFRSLDDELDTRPHVIYLRTQPDAEALEPL